ncbi:hypothetical protein [Calderihabitans maritimus]|uniref:hypothetical protein n=1 Tax=Calderihabitans maritimus TaxID=1246530 RepID=UPI001178B9B8|nr:hypothetical protein [Calderihabitans maritimus]
MAEETKTDFEKQTSSESSLYIEVDHLYLIPVEEGKLQVGERVVFTNPGQDTIEGRTVKFDLPEGYSELQYVEGIDRDATEVTDNQLTVTRDFAPGQATLGIKYLLTSTTPHYVLKKSFDYPTNVFYIVTAPEGVEVTGDKIVDAGITSLGDQDYRFYVAENLVPGEAIDLRVTVGVPTGGGGGSVIPSSSSMKFHSPAHIRFWRESPFRGMNPHLFLVIVILLPTGFAAYGIYRWRTQKAELENVDPEEELFQKLLAKQKSLLEKIKELEEQFSDGKIDEETYKELRDAYKRRLVNVKLKLKKLAG